MTPKQKALRPTGWQVARRKEIESDEKRNQLIKDSFNYDPLTSELTWKINKGYNAKRGKNADSLGRKGYKQVTIGKYVSLVHRVVWFIHYGKWPEYLLDHINGDRRDNRIENLREVDHRQNAHNKEHNRQGGLIGARYHDGRWQSAISYQKKLYYLGSFATDVEASAAYLGVCKFTKQLDAELSAEGEI